MGETAVATALAGTIAPKLFAFVQAKHKLRANLEHDITDIKNEFDMISAAILEYDDGRRRCDVDGAVHKTWIKKVRDLAHDIEDCIDRFTHRVTPETEASWTHQAVHRVKTMGSRNEFAAAIRGLKKRSQDLSNIRDFYKTNIVVGGGSSSAGDAAGSESETETETLSSGPAPVAVGMDEPLEELLELTTREHQQQQQLKVISIVGFDGIGKTLLARQLYKSVADSEQYESQAWVRAADKDGKRVVKEILHQLGVPPPVDGAATASSYHLITKLKHCLGTKRFFIVIDDVRTEFWHDIKDAFPSSVPGVSSRIVVTTAIQSVANICSSAHGHVYVMRTLPQEHSRRLFFKEASIDDPPPDAEDLASYALNKCDGLPLALVTTARFLQSRGDPTRRKWAKLCDNLGEHLETMETLARLKRVLVHSYTSLGTHGVKTCLLYLGMYPSGRPVRRGSLLRRWLAEGLIKHDNNNDRRSDMDVAIDNFEMLLHRSILQPIDVSNNAEVKTCQTHGMMLEFILHKSMRENFVALYYDDDKSPNPEPSKTRWLSLHHKSAATAIVNPKDLRIVRSLTIFGKAHKSVLDFSSYELLRVLDLEECENHLEDKHLKEICNLLLLRYLSLGEAVTVTVLPKEMGKLKLLETLDVRRTKKEMGLPIQVIELPGLIYLLGKFKLQDVGSWRMRKLHMSDNKRLRTVAGFVVDKSQGIFAQLMEHMERLTRVKIWCDSTSASSNLTRLAKAIKDFIMRSTDVKEARSLSLNFSDWSQDLLNFSLENSCYLSSLKLKGSNICSLPPFVTMLGGLTELCLSSPRHQLSGDILAALSRVRGLEYLKLIATRLDKLVIGDGALGSLRRLCIVVEFMSTELEIQKGALPRLESLRLLCKDLDGFCGARILCLGRLKEVALHDGVSDETKHEWKQAARNHPRHPNVLFVKMKEEVIDQKPTGSEPAEMSGTALPHQLLIPAH